ncbi:hypothetical protein EU245_14590 [Lentibacillus lipolyticus]|nr:hypothetical protein EU245_14590 [Lentibacillus lipolyticus]
MKEWWNRKKEKTRKHRKNSSDYTLFDFILDIFFWIPELIVLPFRILFWLAKGMIRNLFDIF